MLYFHTFNNNLEILTGKDMLIRNNKDKIDALDIVLDKRLNANVRILYCYLLYTTDFNYSKKLFKIIQDDLKISSNSLKSCFNQLIDNNLMIVDSTSPKKFTLI